jgi:hypothetical protein
MRPLTCVACLSWSALLAGCAAVQVRPDSPLPRALMQPMPAHVGLVLDSELRGYLHEETRSGDDWKVELGAGHVRLLQAMFTASIGDVQTFTSLDEAKAATGLQVLFQPAIEQYSFATARETTGGYWAVTIRYRIGVLAPQGQPVDVLTLTGYGSSLGGGGSAKSLARATQVAMRDAAAKFLVQLPRQPLAARLREGQIVQADEASAPVADPIEAVPIEP